MNEPINIDEEIRNDTDQTKNIQSEAVPISEVNATLQETPVNNQKPPKKKSSLPVILLFVFLFAFVIGMPYINDFINDLKSNSGLSEIEQAAREEEKRQEEENNKNNSTQTEETLSESTCTKTSELGIYTLVEIQKFSYNKNNQIKESSYSYQYTFVSQDETYLGLTKKCDEDALKYLSNTGYAMACNYSDNKIEINHSFDLETFKTITDGTTIIEANAKLNQKISDVKTTLTANNYVCE